MLFRMRRRCWADGQRRAQEEEAGERGRGGGGGGVLQRSEGSAGLSDSTDAGAHREVRLLRIPD